MHSATNIGNMFTGTSSLADASAIEGWNVLNVTNFSSIFSTGYDSTNSPYATSGILSSDTNFATLKPFTVRPGIWSRINGKYTPNS